MKLKAMLLMVELIVAKSLTYGQFQDHDDVSEEAKEYADDIFALVEERNDIGAIAFDAKYSEDEEIKKVDTAPKWDGKVPGHLKDSKGRFVPEESISDYDKAKENFMDEIETVFGDIECSLDAFRTELKDKINSFTKEAKEKYGKDVGGELSVSLSNFAGNQKIEMKIISSSPSFYLKKKDKDNKFKSVKTSLN